MHDSAATSDIISRRPVHAGWSTDISRHGDRRRAARKGHFFLPHGHVACENGHRRQLLSGVVVGVPYEYCISELNRETMDVWSRGCRTLAQAGAHIVPVSLPHTRFALSVYYTVAPAEAASNLARFTSMCYGDSASGPWVNANHTIACTAPLGNEMPLVERWRRDVMNARKRFLGSEARQRILIGSFVLSAVFFRKYYDKAVALRHLIRRDFNAPFAYRHERTGASVDVIRVDAVLAPTVTPPPRSSHNLNGMGPEDVYADDILTVSASLAGLPAVAIPCGIQFEGQPIQSKSLHALQLIGCGRIFRQQARSAEGKQAHLFLRCAAVLEASV